MDTKDDGDTAQEPEESEERARELEAMERDERNRVVREALGKFGFFMHTTAWLTGCAYLVLLAVFVRQARPWIAIPIAIWTGFLVYHAWRAWHPKTARDRALDTLDKIPVDHLDQDLEASRQAEADRIMKGSDYEAGIKLLVPQGSSGDGDAGGGGGDAPDVSATDHEGGQDAR